VRCGAALGVGRFCLNCGHRIGDPAPADAAPPIAAPDPAPAAAPEPAVLPVQAADPTAVAPATAPLGAPVEPLTTADPVPAPRRPQPGSTAPGSTVPESTWDPREELLPYEEVDELEVDDPVPGRAWIFWVLGAVLLVGLVLVLLRVFATDEDDPAAVDPTTSESSTPVDDASETSNEASEDEDGPTGVGKRIDLARAATFEVPGTAPPTTDFDGNLVAYEAVQMHDGDPSTTWRIAGDATAKVVTVTLGEPAVVYRVGLVNGYTKQVAGVDWYPNNRRILAVTWGFEDGTTVEQTFSENPTMQLLKVPPVQTSTVTLTITSVTPPGSGNLGRDYTAISEVAITGRRAG
jgi:hypothetical protein